MGTNKKYAVKSIFAMFILLTSFFNPFFTYVNTVSYNIDIFFIDNCETNFGIDSFRKKFEFFSKLIFSPTFFKIPNNQTLKRYPGNISYSKMFSK